ncbi:MAG: lipoprotein [Rhodocyclales bacterium]|nr:lipoprotein [Rhodocyclales bacterium]
MHPTHTLLAIFALTALAACGTKTPLTLPSPQARPPAAVAPAPTPAPVDDSNKAGRTAQ